MGKKMYPTDRPTSHRIRDGAILVGIIVVLGLAVIGLTSGAAFVMGVQVLDSGSSSSHAAPPDPNPILVRAHEEAANIIRHAQQRAESRQSSLVSVAQKRAAKIIRHAEAEVRKLKLLANDLRNHLTPTPGVVSSPVPVIAYPTPTPTSSLPYVGNFPARWDIVAYQTDPSTGTVYVENVKYKPYSGSITLVFTGRHHKKLGRRIGRFFNVPGQSTAVVSVGLPPRGWTHYRVVVSNIS